MDFHILFLGDVVKIINDKTVQVFTSQELTNILESDNNYNYIYLGSDITLENGINIGDFKEKIVIDGTSNGVRYKLIGMNSVDASETIVMNVGTKNIIVKNLDIEYTNTNGVIYVPLDKSYSNSVIEYNNVYFNGTKLSYNPYGTTKIVDSRITIKTVNEVAGTTVAESDRVIIGGNSVINSNSSSSPLFYFRNDTSNPSVIFSCKSYIVISTDTMAFMNGTNRLNFTILHDTYVNLVTGNGFASYSTHGAYNVLIEERATLSFIENFYQRIPMWNIFGNFVMKKDSSVQLINSYVNTPSDNYNLYFKGNNSKMILDYPKEFVIYTKNANVIYTNSTLSFDIKCSRINMWTNSTDVSSAGDINNLPDYSWFKDGDMIISGTYTASETVISSHNFTQEELNLLPDLSNFSFQSKKQFSIGSAYLNIHPINSTRNVISGHTEDFSDVLIKYGDNESIVSADSDGFFEYNLPSNIVDGTEIEFISNVSTSFLYGSRVINSPYDGELSIKSIDPTFSFSLVPIQSDSFIFGRTNELVIEVVDSRIVSSDWKLYGYMDGLFSSQMGYVLNDALIFRKFDNSDIILNGEEQLLYVGVGNEGNPLKTDITFSKEKGPLLDLTNEALEANEEYFASINFVLKE